jgi:lambda repressor-like predicted transcriptional regulator
MNVPMPMTIEYEIAIVAQVQVFAVSTRSQMSSTMIARVLAASYRKLSQFLAHALRSC